jgi:hypothetical protein
MVVPGNGWPMFEMTTAGAAGLKVQLFLVHSSCGQVQGKQSGRRKKHRHQNRGAVDTNFDVYIEMVWN